MESATKTAPTKMITKRARFAGRNKRLFGPVQLVVGVKHHDDVVDDVDQPERPNDHGDGHDELQDAWKETHGQIGINTGESMRSMSSIIR